MKDTDHAAQRGALKLRGFVVMATIIVSGVQANVAQSADLVYSRTGTIPIILTAPHGGQESIPGVLIRKKGVTATDLRTLEITEQLAAKLATIIGAEPYVVAARFSRRYIDANRPSEEAFENAAAGPIYSAYHDKIRSYVDQVRAKFPNGALLVDIHGQSSAPEIIHRGTRNGSTVKNLIGRYGNEALVGPNSLLGVMHAKGYGVFPPNTVPGKPNESSDYLGGYTVLSYGSSSSNGIDAIQLELGSALRARAAIADDLAAAIVVFYRQYLEIAGSQK